MEFHKHSLNVDDSHISFKSNWIQKLEVYQTAMDHEQSVRTSYQTLLTTLEIVLISFVFLLDQFILIEHLWKFILLGVILCFFFGIACEYRARNVDIWRVLIVLLVQQTDVEKAFIQGKISMGSVWDSWSQIWWTVWPLVWENTDHFPSIIMGLYFVDLRWDSANCKMGCNSGTSGMDFLCIPALLTRGRNYVTGFIQTLMWLHVKKQGGIVARLKEWELPIKVLWFLPPLKNYHPLFFE